MTEREARRLGAALVLKAAAGSSIGQWWESQYKPFISAYQTAMGSPTAKGNVTQAAQNLWEAKPGTLLGALGLFGGGALGSMSNDRGAALRWALMLGGLGLGTGYAWKNRDKWGRGFAEWLQPHIKHAMQPTIDDALKQVDTRINDMRKDPVYGMANQVASMFKRPAGPSK